MGLLALCALGCGSRDGSQPSDGGTEEAATRDGGADDSTAQGAGDATLDGVAPGLNDAASDGQGATDGQPQGGGDAGADARTTDGAMTEPLGCTADGWCWSNPWPFGYDFTGVWADSATDAWAVGNTGAVLHFDGSKWSQLPQDQHLFLLAVWASGPSDAWVVGLGGSLLHWNGRTFEDRSASTSNNFQAVWGSGPGDVWAVGLGGAAYHFDGTSWSSVSSGTTSPLDSVWGSAHDDVWAGADNGSLRHFDGSGWTAVTSPVTVPIKSFSGSGRSDAWAATDTQVLHWNGSAWSVASSTVAGNGGTISSLWASGPSDVWALCNQRDAAHYDGNSWTSTALPLTAGVVQFISGSGPTDMWLAGSLGALDHWDGSQTKPETSTVTSVTITSIAPISSTEAWAATNGSPPLHFTGAPPWSPVAVPAGSVGPALVWNAGPGDLWGIVDSPTTSVTHWNGSTWSSATTIPGPNVPAAPAAIWGSDAAHVFIAGYSGVYRSGTTTWQSVTNVTSLADVWGSGPSNVWFGADGWTYDHYDGGTWSAMGIGGNTGQGFFGVWTSGPSDVWFVGAYGGIWHYDGNSLTKQPTTSAVWANNSLRSIWGSNASDVWSVGDLGVIVHLESGTWNLKQSGTLGNLRRIIGTDAANIWVGGQSGIILRHKL